MLRKALILRLFNAFTIQRWNDHIRPAPLVEMDKNGHKMAIAYCLARYAEDNGTSVAWHNLIRGGVFELLRRTVLSDIKSPIYNTLSTKYPEVFRELSQWVYEQLETEFSNDRLLAELRSYLVSDDLLDNVSRDILAAAHIYASHWEFQIIREASPSSEKIRQIENMMFLDLAPYAKLPGVRCLLERKPVAGFIDLVGQLRFQVRWGQTPRLPVTSVLGHSMMVAALAYFLTREFPDPACDSLLKNNFFNGLFHDIPESLTRDIISPVKLAVPKFCEVLSEIERDLVSKQIHPLLDPTWIKDFVYLTENEFAAKIVNDGVVELVSSEAIVSEYNSDKYQPLDGSLTKIADHLAAFVEAHKSIEAGFSTPELQDGHHELRKLYTNRKVAGLNIGSIYADF